MTQEHAKLLLKKYLAAYRIYPEHRNDLFPFEEDAVYKIAELAELNASKILKTAFELLDRASEIDDQIIIDDKFIHSIEDKNIFEDKPAKGIATATPINLIEKAKKKE